MIERLLDANRNRAMEALRVLEDIARFGPAGAAPVSAGDAAGDCKSMRHRLLSTLAPLDAGRFIASRDVANDAGCAREGEREYERASVVEIAEGNAQRLTESLRCLEEAAKVRDAHIARSIERIRYDAYELAQRIVRSLGTGRGRQWRLCLLLTKSACRRPWREVLELALDAGCDAVQVREKDMEGGALAEHARFVVECCRVRGASTIINDRVDIALASGADGVHLGRGDLAIHDARRIVGRTLLIGATAHSVEEALDAAATGADMIGIGPMFPSATKPGLPCAGPNLLRAVLHAVPSMPHLAIGGIGPQEAQSLVAAGARGVAVSHAICSASDPAAVTREMLCAMPA